MLVQLFEQPSEPSSEVRGIGELGTFNEKALGEYDFREVLGLAFAYLLAPAVAWLVRHRIPRALAIVLTVPAVLCSALVKPMPVTQVTRMSLPSRVAAAMRNAGAFVV